MRGNSCDIVITTRYFSPKWLPYGILYFGYVLERFPDLTNSQTLPQTKHKRGQIKTSNPNNMHRFWLGLIPIYTVSLVTNMYVYIQCDDKFIWKPCLTFLIPKMMHNQAKLSNCDFI